MNGHTLKAAHHRYQMDEYYRLQARVRTQARNEERARKDAERNAQIAEAQYAAYVQSFEMGSDDARR